MPASRPICFLLRLTPQLAKAVAPGQVVGFDIVELCPIKGNIASDFLAAKILYRLLGYVFPTKK